MAPNGAILKNLKEIRQILNFLLWQEYLRSWSHVAGPTFEEWKKRHNLPESTKEPK